MDTSQDKIAAVKGFTKRNEHMSAWTNLFLQEQSLTWVNLRETRNWFRSYIGEEIINRIKEAFCTLFFVAG